MNQRKLEKENESENKEAADKKTNTAKGGRARIKRADAAAINANVAEKYLSEAEKEEA